MKLYYISAFFLLAIVQLHAENIESKSLVNLISKVKSNFKEVKNIEYEAEINGELSVDAVKLLNASDEMSKGRERVKVSMSQDYWLLEGTSWNALSVMGRDYLFGHDQMGHAELDRMTGRMLVTKQPPKEWQSISGFAVIFNPYAFLSKPEVKLSTGKPQFLLGDITRNDMWSILMEKARLIEYKEQGENYVLKIPGNSCYTTKKAFAWIVKIDKKIHIPISIQGLTEDGLILTECSVTEIGSVSFSSGALPFYYPKKMVSKDSRLFGGEKLTNTTRIDITRVDVNRLANSSVEAFGIDPSSATSIFDKDKNVIIKIPN